MITQLSARDFKSHLHYFYWINFNTGKLMNIAQYLFYLLFFALFYYKLFCIPDQKSDLPIVVTQ